MRFFNIDTLGNLDDRSLCILDAVPEGIGAKYSRLARGRTIAADFPANASIRMTPDRTGIKLASLIGNTNSFLIVHRDVKDVIAAEHQRRGDRWPIEYLPFTLVNHKGRPHSADYVLVNPIGVVDCADLAASQIELFEGDRDKVVSIERLVLDPEKLQDAPPLFRIRETPGQYTVDEALAAALQAKGFSNVMLTPIETKA